MFALRIIMTIGRIIRTVSLVAIVSATIVGCGPLQENMSFYPFQGEIDGNYVSTRKVEVPFGTELELTIQSPNGDTIIASGYLVRWLDENSTAIAINRKDIAGLSQRVPETKENLTTVRKYFNEIYIRNSALGI